VYVQLKIFRHWEYPKPLNFCVKWKVAKEKENHNARIEKSGTRHASVPMWQELLTIEKVDKMDNLNHHR